MKVGTLLEWKGETVDGTPFHDFGIVIQMVDNHRAWVQWPSHAKSLVDDRRLPHRMRILK